MSQNIAYSVLSGGWEEVLAEVLVSDVMRELASFLIERERSGAVLYPPKQSIFRALDMTPIADVKVVILGQDPYHGAGQANGLAFSVRRGMKIPPSLRNIYREVSESTGIESPEHGSLESWAAQGVLLLNSVLTVEEGCAGAHQNKGWEYFTDKVIEVINQSSVPTVFMCWGAYAHKKSRLIDTSKHLVLHSVHPSPLSAYRGFFGSNHFVLANEFLRQVGRSEIDWSIAE